MWKKISAYILGIALAFLGVLYAYSWHQHQQRAEQARKLPADLAGKYEALDSLGDLDLDPSGLTLAKLEERFHQPARTLPGAKNTTRVDPRQIRPHRIAVGGIYLGEPIEDAKQFCKKRGYGVELGLNQFTWDKHWKAICAGTGTKVDFLVFANQDLMKDQLNQ